jgi:hypothetical protein
VFTSGKNVSGDIFVQNNSTIKYHQSEQFHNKISPSEQFHNKISPSEQFHNKISKSYKETKSIPLTYKYITGPELLLYNY